MNVAFPRRDRITHEAPWTDADGGITWCGITFYWNDPMYPLALPSNTECDCMACIARPEAMIEFSGALNVINARALAKLDFYAEDKESL